MKTMEELARELADKLEAMQQEMNRLKARQAGLIEKLTPEQKALIVSPKNSQS